MYAVSDGATAFAGGGCHCSLQGAPIRGIFVLCSLQSFLFICQLFSCVVAVVVFFFMPVVAVRVRHAA
jgi:hypothetical protein